MALLQLHIDGDATVFVVDIAQLQDAAFSTATDADAGAAGLSLQGVLESDAFVKVFCDPRNDADALWAQFGVYPANVRCLQLALVMRRRHSGIHVPHVFGLSKILRLHGEIPAAESVVIADVQRRAPGLMFPDKGGSYRIMFDRPLDETVLQYAAADVRYLVATYARIVAPLPADKLERVRVASARRVAVCKQANYEAKGRHKSLAEQF
jgi:hypothetical protein